MDNRKHNGGARPGTGPKPLPPGEKKVQVVINIKQKYAADFEAKAKVLAASYVKKIDGCATCKRNITTLEAGYWCITNCISGSKYEAATSNNDSNNLP